MESVSGAKNARNFGKAALIAGLIIIAAVAVFWYFTRVYKVQRAEIQQADAIAEQVAQQAQQLQKNAETAQTVASPPAFSSDKVAPPSNPVKEKVPEVNPVERANPFADAYENPFE